MMAALILPSSVMIIGLFLYNLNLERQYDQEKVLKAEEEIALSFSGSISEEKKILTEANGQADFISFCNSSRLEHTEKKASGFFLNYGAEVLGADEAVAAFLLNSETGFLYPFYKNINMGDLSSAIKEFGQSSFGEKDGFQTAVFRYEGTAYIACIEKQRFGSLIVLMDPRKNVAAVSYNQILKERGEYRFLTPEVTGGEYDYEPAKVGELALYVWFSGKFTGFKPIQVLILTMIMVLIMLQSCIFFSVIHRILKPLKEISETMYGISEGDMEKRVPALSGLNEITRMGTEINHMLESLRTQEEESFMIRMDAVQAKLQYLQLQIRPHFYLNCLKNLRSLIALDKKEEAQTLVLGLANYISHAFMDVKNFITIREELEAAESYVNLCRMLSADVFLKLVLSGECTNLKCLPMSILTFVENSIKHITRPGTLHITVSVRPFDDGFESRAMQIIIKDDGGGYPERVLEEFERLDPSRMQYRRENIGILNVCYRLWLVYRDEAEMLLRNEGDCAVTEMTVPMDAELIR